MNSAPTRRTVSTPKNFLSAALPEKSRRCRSFSNTSRRARRSTSGLSDRTPSARRAGRTSRSAPTRPRRSPAWAPKTSATPRPTSICRSTRSASTRPTTSITVRPRATGPKSPSAVKTSARASSRCQRRSTLKTCLPAPFTIASSRPTSGGPRRPTTRRSTSARLPVRTRTCASRPDSSYLPDCRAYELVTPGYAGAVQIMPGEALTNFGSTFGAFPQAPQNYGFATSPSRFVYMGGLGSVEGQEAPNALLDMYLANRTDHGWVTTFPSIKGYEAKFTYGFGCSESMDLCVSFPGESTKLNPETNENETDSPVGIALPLSGRRQSDRPTAYERHRDPGRVLISTGTSASLATSATSSSRRRPNSPRGPTPKRQGPSTTTTSRRKRSCRSRTPNLANRFPR